MTRGIGVHEPRQFGGARVTDVPTAATRARTPDLHEVSTARARRRALVYQAHSDRVVAQAVARAKAGDREAIRFLYAHFSVKVYDYVFSMLRDQNRTEDVTQHVFLKLMSVIDKYEPRQVPFKSWLMRVARDVAVDHLRVEPHVPYREVHPPVREGGSARRRRWELEQAVEVLSEERRRAIVQEMVDVTAGETATALEQSGASIRDLHRRPREVLARELLDGDGTPPARAAVS